MDSWVNFEGYPVITVTRNYSSNQVELKQDRFLNDNATEDLTQNKHIWQVPINYATSSILNFNDTKPAFWLKQSSYNVKLDIDSEDWIILNKQQTGFKFNPYHLKKKKDLFS